MFKRWVKNGLDRVYVNGLPQSGEKAWFEEKDGSIVLKYRCIDSVPSYPLRLFIENYESVIESELGISPEELRKLTYLEFAEIVEHGR